LNTFRKPFVLWSDLVASVDDVFDDVWDKNYKSEKLNFTFDRQEILDKGLLQKMVDRPLVPAAIVEQIYEELEAPKAPEMFIEDLVPTDIVITGIVINKIK